MISDRYFRDFGNPILEEGAMFSFSDVSVGGSGGGFGSFNFNLPNVTIGGSPGSPDVRRILTDIANSSEAALQANLQSYQTGQISADAAISTAWDILNKMTSAMLQYGEQGRISAAERDRRIDPRFLRWDYVAYYIDPISQLATGKPASVPALPAVSGNAPVYGAGIGAFGMRNETLILLLLLGLIVWKALRKK